MNINLSSWIIKRLSFYNLWHEKSSFIRFSLYSISLLERHLYGFQSFKKLFIICLSNPNIVHMLCILKQFFIRNVISYETLITFYQCLKMVFMKEKIWYSNSLKLVFLNSYKFSGHENSQWENIPKCTHHYLPYLLLILDKSKYYKKDRSNLLLFRFSYRNQAVYTYIYPKSQNKSNLTAGKAK